jgi:hypothetical protein
VAKRFALVFFASMFVYASGCDQPVSDMHELPPPEVTGAVQQKAINTTTSSGDTGSCICTSDEDCGTATACAQPICNCSSCSTIKLTGSCTSDGNPCTADSCSNGTCAHIAVADNTPCTSDGNPCTNDICVAGTCAHNSLPDNTSCNADNDACTANDTCQGGSCIAGSRTICAPLECNTVSCNTATGTCVVTPIDGNCGGNECTTPGTCSAGTCTGTGQTDCSGDDDQCNVGVCVPDLGCAKTPTKEGQGCTLADKCIVTPTCAGGQCAGDPKQCPPDTECATYRCNSSTGDCDPTYASSNQKCNPQNDCVDPATTFCDGNGGCTGAPLQDRTPCGLVGCASSWCVAGTCTCVDEDGNPIDAGMSDGATADDRDGSITNGEIDGGRTGSEGADADGCSIGRRPADTGTLICGLALALLLVRRRTQRQL